VHVRLGVRSAVDIERFRGEGRDVVHFDLDDPRTFGAAIAGVDRLFMLTGYTVAMTHHSKTLVDAAPKAGVTHIVNQGVFAEWDCTDPHFAWFGLVESYIEASGISWTHLHPNLFMEYLLKSAPPVAGDFNVFWGEARVGWVALQDLAAVTSRVLIEGPARHAGKNYWLSTEVHTGPEVAAIFSDVLGRPIRCIVRQPAELEAIFLCGALKVESWYAKGGVDWCVQIADGRMGYIGTVRDDVPHLLGRPATTLRQWAGIHKDPTCIHRNSGRRLTYKPRF
jgi:NAD(P)H dehydrogenase (quinone)